MKNLLLILLATLFVACNEGTRYDEPEVPTTWESTGFIDIKDVKWELSERWKPTKGNVYTLQPTYVSVVRVEKAVLKGDSIDFSNSKVWFANPQTGAGGEPLFPADFTYEETNSEIILNIECPPQIAEEPTEEPFPTIRFIYTYYTTY